MIACTVLCKKCTATFHKNRFELFLYGGGMQPLHATATCSQVSLLQSSRDETWRFNNKGGGLPLTFPTNACQGFPNPNHVFSMKSAPWVMNLWNMLFQVSQWFLALGRLTIYNPYHSPASPSCKRRNIKQSGPCCAKPCGGSKRAMAGHSRCRTLFVNMN